MYVCKWLSRLLCLNAVVNFFTFEAILPFTNVFISYTRTFEGVVHPVHDLFKKLAVDIFCEAKDHSTRRGQATHKEKVLKRQKVNINIRHNYDHRLFIKMNGVSPLPPTVQQ